MLEDYFKLAWQGISHRRLRSWLTMIGIFIGIIAVVSLITLGNGLQHFIDAQLDKVGGDRLMITPGGGDITSGGTGSSVVGARLMQEDLEVIRDVRGVDSAAGALVTTARVRLCDKQKYITVFGIPTEKQYQAGLQDVDWFQVDEGRVLEDGDTYDAQIGPDSDDFCDREVSLRQKIEIEGKKFNLVGRNKKTGNPIHDSKITIPIDVAHDLFNKTDEYTQITVEIQGGYDVQEVKENIEEDLRRHRDVEEDEEDFTVETPENLLGVFKDVINMVTVVLAGIAGISLLVGGIGIMTTMYTSVLERTVQIGIMKAVGARNSDILTIFLIESGLLGLIGGIIGIILGLAVSKGAEYVIQMYLSEYQIYASPELIIGTLLFSFLVGTISGYLPAKRAAKMQPVDALSYR